MRFKSVFLIALNVNYLTNYLSFVVTTLHAKRRKEDKAFNIYNQR